jgi:hypothetical protein
VPTRIKLATTTNLATLLEMRTHSRPQLNPAGQGPALPKKDRLPALGVVVPLTEKRPPRDWKATNDRLRDMGDLTVLIDPAVLLVGRGHGRGRAYPEAVIQLAAVVRAYFHFPLRQIEGKLREMLTTMDQNKDLAPDFSTLCRRLVLTPLPALPHSSAGPGHGVVVIIDSTGVRVSEARGWHQDRGYAKDHRRVKYLKLHLGIDALTGELCAYDITKSYGKGTGDSAVAPNLVREAEQWARDSGRHFVGGIGDGAYDSGELYSACAELDARWLAPIPDNAVRGRHPDRNRHLTGVKRLGEEYHDRMGYHERSTIEATNGALKRTLSLSSRSRSFEGQATEIAWQLWVYAQHLVRTPRAELRLTG